MLLLTLFPPGPPDGTDGGERGERDTHEAVRQREAEEEGDRGGQSVSHQPHTYTEAASPSGIVCSEALSCIYM